MKIIKYNSYKSIIVEFQDDFHGKVHTGYNCFLQGNINNPYHRTVYNIGYIGENIKTKENLILKKSYRVWHSMLNRCYSIKSRNNNLSYSNCKVCEEWQSYYNFDKWFNENYYELDNEIVELDKDILYKGNKVYSPYNCIFVPDSINCLFTKSEKIRGDCPIGVVWHNRDKVYEAWCSNGHKHLIYLGRFHDEINAFQTYKKYKENLIKQIADEYKNKIPEKLYNAMYTYKVDITD